MKLRDAKSLQKNSFTYPPSRNTFCLNFLRTHHDYYFPNRLWKCASKISFRKYKQKIVLLVIYLFHYDSSKSTSFMLNVKFDFAFEHGFCQVNSNLLQYKDYKNILHFSACVLLLPIMVIIFFYSILTSVSNSHFH